MRPFLQSGQNGHLPAPPEKRFLIIFIILFGGLFGILCMAGAAEIHGRVMDPEGNSYLQGARVRLVELGRTVHTQRGGSFFFRRLKPGKYHLEVKYIGYSDYTQMVEIRAPEEKFSLSLTMPSEQIVELETFEVKGTKSGQAKAFNQRKAASNLTEVVASDAFGQFVDRNPAEALQRVVGISVQEDQGEGKFIIVRGADPSLNTIAVDGVVSATPEEDGRSTALNIISIDQLERIEVQKTWLPDDWAHFIGGSVNLVTRSALDREGSHTGFEYAGGQYDASEERSRRLSTTYSNSWGEKKRIGLSLSFDWSEDNRGSDTLDADGWDPDAQPDLKGLKRGFVLQGIQLEDFLIKRERIGISSKFEFELNENHRWFASVSSNQFDDYEVLQETHLDPGNSDNNYTGVAALTTELALALGYDFDEALGEFIDPEIEARVKGGNVKERRLFLDEAIQLGTIAYDEASKTYTFIDMESNAQKTLQTTVTEDSILTYHIGGEHQLGDALSIDYMFYQSEADKNWNERQLQLEAEDFDLRLMVVDGRPVITDKGEKLSKTEVYRISDNEGFNSNLGSIENNFFLSDDKRSGAEFNVELESDWFGLQWITKAGWAVDFRDKAFIRDFNQFSRVDTGGQGVLTLGDEPFSGGELSEFLPDYGDSGDYPFGPKFDVEATQAFIGDSGEYEFVQTDDDLTLAITDAVLKDFEAEEDITAAYLMQTLNWKGWEFIAGFRWEQTKNTFTTNRVITKREDLAEDVQAVLPPSFQFIQPRFWSSLFDKFGEESVIQSIKSERTYDSALYAFHVNRRFGDNWVARAALTKTIARPKYTDLVPREIVDISGARFIDNAELPAFELKPMTSVNFDASLSYYFKSFGLVSVAGFHKKLDGPIYDEIRTLGPADPLAQELTARYFSNPLESPEWNTERKANAGSGNLRGIEISFEKRFSKLPSPFDGLGLQANATFVDSEVELLAEQREGEKVPLFLQSDKIANVSLSYEKYKFFVRLSWVFRGKYLDDSIVAGDFIVDLENKLELPANSLDTWVNDFSRLDLLVEYRPFNWLTLFAEGTNISNEPLGKFQGTTSRLASIQFTEPLYFIGVKTSL